MPLSLPNCLSTMIIKARHIALLAATLLSTSFAFADEQRDELVRRIADAQGITEIIDQQQEQGRVALQAYAAKMLDEASGGKATPQHKAAFEKFVARSAQMFSAKEITAAWASQYGRDLSIQDLQDILRYYESPLGQRELASVKRAMPAFMQWISAEGQARGTVLIQDFIAELRAGNER